MYTLANEDFIRLTTFIRANYGINLSNKKQLIVSRLTDLLVSNGFANFNEYVTHILNNKNSADIEILLNRLTTNYTYFNRETAHFDYFKNIVLPELEAKKRNQVLSIWSAGCSTGQEPYTLSMILKDYFRGKGGNWDTRILATDISNKALTQARNGLYPEEGVVDFPEAWKKTYFKKTGVPHQLSVTDDIKSNVIFKPFNLMDNINFKLKFDVIFCRNVMIYFDKPTRAALTKRFYDATAPGGYLFIGHSEGLIDDADTADTYRYIMPAVYQKPL